MKKVVSLTRRAIEEYNMIEEGDRIAVGVSGGKDSLVLLCALAELAKYYPKKFTVIALTLDMGYNADYSKIHALCDELGVEFKVKYTNIKEVIFGDESTFNENYFTVNFRVAGAKLKGEAQKLKKEVDGLDRKGMAELSVQYASGKFSIGSFENLESNLLDKHDRPKEGFSVDTEGDVTLALDKRLTKELLREGFVRETIRKIQVMRKDAGFAVEQRIKAVIKCGDEEGTQAIKEYEDKIKADILAIELCDDLDTSVVDKSEIAGHEVEIKLLLI